MGKDVMDYFSKITLGLAIVNAIIVAMADKKLSKAEINKIFRLILQGLGYEGIVPAGALSVKFTKTGALSILISPEIIAKLGIK